MRGRATEPDAPRRSAQFTAREMDCLRLLVLGLTDQEIARELSITHATVRFHLESSRRKVGAKSRTHLAAKAVALGLVSPSSDRPLG